ncbi:DUF3135 domain-containing protein [Salinispirillum marinum]|uniref:DUF3135 domain-containing protein n=2 Tax=Saccharospirillaceae TaxID=255527 RepID=A0ABV8BAG6_9GAMM
MQPIEIPDFNELMRMAREEPEALETMRKEYTEQLLASAPPESLHRLQGMAFVLDAKRRTAHSPAEVCKAMSDLMLERLKVLQANFEDIKGIANTVNERKDEDYNSGISVQSAIDKTKVVSIFRPNQKD